MKEKLQNRKSIGSISGIKKQEQRTKVNTIVIIKEESNYPQSSLIKLFDKNRTFYYKIIKEGTYPPSNQYYYTKYSKHPIPNNYIIKTQYGKAKHFTQFQSFKSATYAACQYYKELNKIKAQTNTKRTNMNNKISNSLDLYYLSVLTKYHKVLKIAHQVLNIVEEEQENIFYSNDNIKIKHIQFEIGDEQFDIYFEKFDKKSAISDIKQKINLKIKKQILLLLVDILQPIVFEESEDIPDITDKNI
ncbi:25372_t:CDS:2, partial [Gigaspora margarita]